MGVQQLRELAANRGHWLFLESEVDQAPGCDQALKNFDRHRQTFQNLGISADLIGDTVLRNNLLKLCPCLIFKAM